MNDEKLNKQLKQLGRLAKIQRMAEEQKAQTAQAEKNKDIDFAKIMSDVKPLKPCNRYQPPRDTSPIKVRRQNQNNEMSEDYFYVGQDSEVLAPAVFSKNGRGVDDIRRLQNKHWPIVADVDLHGYTQEEAQKVLNEFIEYIQKYGVVGEIIHGSGLGSKDYEPVLKNLVRRWLMAHPQVIAYAQPHSQNDGAVYVLLKKRR